MYVCVYLYVCLCLPVSVLEIESLPRLQLTSRLVWLASEPQRPAWLRLLTMGIQVVPPLLAFLLGFLCSHINHLAECLSGAALALRDI